MAITSFLLLQKKKVKVLFHNKNNFVYIFAMTRYFFFTQAEVKLWKNIQFTLLI